MSVIENIRLLWKRSDATEAMESYEEAKKQLAEATVIATELRGHRQRNHLGERIGKAYRAERR